MGDPWYCGWTAGQQVERSILRQGHDLQQNLSHSPRLSPAQFRLKVQNRGLKHQSFVKHMVTRKQ